jgi:type II secretory pathway component GspD/PulD (secretin)
MAQTPKPEAVAPATTASIPPGRLVHSTLNSAIDHYRRGEYEKADAEFQRARQGQADLSPNQKKDLENYLALNTKALAARREGVSKLRDAELAIRAGRVQQASVLLQAVCANNFLTPADKQRAQQLSEQLRPGPVGTSAVTPITNSALTLARSKLQQARAMEAKGHFDAAEQLAKEADNLNATFTLSEDNPRKVLADITHMRSDPKAMLAAARIAFQAGDLDRADRLAREADKVTSAWSRTVHLWGDSPAKVLRDVQFARAKAAVAVAPAPAAAPTPENPRQNNNVTLAKATDNTPMGTSAATAQTQPAKPEAARELIKQAKKALLDGDYAKARQLATQAKNMKPQLEWWEDTPDKILNDVQRAEAAKQPATSKSGASAVADAKSDPKGLMRQGRELLQAGKLDEAKEMAQRAAAPGTTHWGLFEDSPEKLLRDVTAAKNKHDQEESVQVLAEARKCLETGDLDKAASLAYRADRLHGAYSVWDLGDRPQKVLAEVDAARAKNRKIKLPPPVGPAVAQAKDDKKSDYAKAKDVTAKAPEKASKPADVKPATTAVAQATQPARPAVLPAPTAPVATGPAVAAAPAKPTIKAPDTSVASAKSPTDDNATQARRLVAEARTALRAGDNLKALSLANQADVLDVTFDRPNEDTPNNIRRDLAIAQGNTQPAKPAATARVASGAPASTATTAMAPKPPQIEDPKPKALALLHEARQLAQGGMLAEARLKVIEAQKLNAIYNPLEERPDQILAQLSAACSHRIDGLVQQANDTISAGPLDATRYERVVADLTQARQMAAGFGLDTQPVDAKLTWVRQAREQVVAAARQPVPSAVPTSPSQVVQVQHTEAAQPGAPTMLPPALPVVSAGAVMLEKSRLELRQGETGNARRLAEEAYKSHADCRTEAEALLRSIDAEEFTQKVLTSRRSFEAGLLAYKNRDYSQASTIFRTLDVSLLDADKQGKLKELMLTPELQPKALTLAAAKVPVPGAARVAGGAGAATATTPAVGSAQANDAAPAAVPLEQSLAERTKAMQEIRFQKMREEGLSAQREASDRFQAGDTDRALVILQDYLGRLRDGQLEQERVALLQRPVDARLQQFKTLKAQRDFEKVVTNQKGAMAELKAKEALAEDNKKRQITDLMKQYHTFFKEGKYKEAEAYAMRARELDPDDMVLNAAVYTARIHHNQSTAKAAKDSRADMFVDQLNDTEDEGPSVTTKDPIKFGKEYAERAGKRRSLEAGLLFGPKSEKERQIENRLQTPVSVEFKDSPGYQVIQDLRDSTGINIVIDKPALEEEGISLDRPVSMKLDNIALKSALNLLLHQMRLTYIVKDEVLQVTTESHARGKLVPKTFPVADLIIPVDNYMVPNSSNLTRILDAAHEPNVHLGGMSPAQGIHSLQNGTPVSPGVSPGVGVPPAPTALATSNATVTTRSPGQTMEDLLIKLITNTIAPQSWSDVGGPGTIDYFPLGMALVINQTPDIQEQVAELLAALRRLQDLEVAVEVRMISLSESFFERIGLDFNINLKTNSLNGGYQPQLVTQQFQPAGFVNDFNPKKAVIGLQSAGSTNGNQAAYTSDLAIPIQNSSFNYAIPPFGGYPNIPGADGGLSMGLAFLSDIQVFMFMEAAQGDRRTNVMQAPKLTMFNGQTATITINDQQYFVTNVTVVQAGGQVVFVPQNTPTPLGVNLAIQPVVSADRRFVRMNLSPRLTNLASALVPLFPVTSFITPVFEGGAQGQPVPFTQFIQQPTFTTVVVQTTVSVPDGGTVLLGGLKLLNEGRNEFGPPVLSKIPYLDRLFKNVGYGRDTSSLMIMVTPRIIINAEEEEKQTGGGITGP